MTDLRVTNALPKLPGYTFQGLSQPVTFNKSHSLGFSGGVPQVKPVVPLGANAEADTEGSPSGFSEKAIFAKFPQWNSLKDKALRFFGYFTERVHESSIEKFRIRKVCITALLIDGTLSISETPAFPNSGLKPGTLMSRHTESNIKASQLAVGGSFEMRGRTFHVVDCDAATRRFFEEMSIPQGEPIEYPPDQFEALAAKPKAVIDADHIQMKRNVEMQAAALSGHQASFLTPEEREKARNFLEHDREVLQFSAVWDGRHFRINYYLSDGTFSVMNDLPPNSGRDPNSIFIRRGKAPNGRVVHKAMDTISNPRMVESVHLTELDITTGCFITLFDRSFYVYDCDAFTKNYYLEKYGIDVKSFERPSIEGEAKPTFRPMEIPPFNGYGSDEDSAQSFRSLVAKAPKKDFIKFFKHLGDVLRFTAVHYKAAPEDEDREFIFCYYLADDSVSVYEHPKRNSGHIGGKIFSRSVVKSVKAEDLQVGSTVTLGGKVYLLTALDDRTKKFLETGIHMGSSGLQAEELIHRVRHALNQRFVRVTEGYRHFSSGQSGISIKDLQNLLKECEIRVDDPQHIQNLMEAADRDRDGVINLSEFLENIMGQPIIQSTSSQANISKAQQEAATFYATGRTYAELQDERARMEFADKILKLFIAKLEARRAFIVDTFRIVSDKSLDGLIGVDTFKSVVQDKLGLNLTQEELDALVFKFFYTPGVKDFLSRRLTLREFRRIVEQ